jgi:hypothetical protein
MTVIQNSTWSVVQLIEGSCEKVLASQLLHYADSASRTEMPSLLSLQCDQFYISLPVIHNVAFTTASHSSFNLRAFHIMLCSNVPQNSSK